MLQPPSLLSPGDGTQINNSTPELAWSAVAQAAGYQLQLDDNTDFSSPVIDVTISATSYTPAASLADGSYSWRVRTKDNAGIFGPWSTSRTFEIKSGYKVFIPAISKGS